MVRELKPGDVVVYLDSRDGIERQGLVTAYVPDATGNGAGFPGFVCLDSVTEKHVWGYLSQVTAINGEAIG